MSRIFYYIKLFVDWLISLPSWSLVTLKRFYRNVKLLDSRFAIAMLFVEIEKKIAHRFADKWRANKHEHSVIESYLLRHGYGNIMNNEIEKVDSKTVCQIAQSKSPIWVCWWQGEDCMPPIVSICYKRILSHSNGHPVNFITFANYSDYVDIPCDLVEKAQDGELKMAHLSDLLRLKLLAKYGGLWVDLTVFPTKDIDEKYFSESFVSLKSCPYYNDTVTTYRWSSFFIGATVNNKFMNALSVAMETYLTSERYVIHYLLIDYLIDLLYNLNDEFKESIDKLPLLNSDIHKLRQIQNMPFDSCEWERLVSQTALSKMSYREFAIEVTENGDETFYGHIIHNS